MNAMPSCISWIVGILLLKSNDIYLTLKEPGLLTPSHSRGGGRFPPPRISAAERQKILKFGTYVGLVNTNVLTKLQY